MLRSKLLSGLMLIVAAIAVLPAGAQAAAWSTPYDAADPTANAADPVVVGLNDGASVALWTQNEGGINVVKAYTHSADGVAGSIENVSSSSSFDIRAAADASGNVMAIWLSSDGATFRVGSSLRDRATGTWSAPIYISSVGTNAAYPAIEFDSSGNAFAVWFDTASTMYSATWSQATATWSGPSVFAFTAASEQSHIATDSSGNIHVVYGHYDGTNTRAAHVGYEGGSWGAMTLLSQPSGDADNFDIEVDASGNVHVAWARFDGTYDKVQARTRIAGTAWTSNPIFRLGAATSTESNPDFGMNSAGDVVLAWQKNSGVASRYIQYAEQSAGTGTWGTVTDLTDQSLASTEPIVEGTDTGFLMIFRQGSAGTSVFATTRSSLATPWDTPAQISTSPNNLASIGLDADGVGNGHAIWYDSVENDIEATHWDSIAPTFGATSVPTTSVAGTSVSMSASATDIGTGLAAGQPAWDFGDAAAGTGDAVTHTYAAAGTYNVIYTATDNAGNSISGMGTITVTASTSGGGGSGSGGGSTGGTDSSGGAAPLPAAQTPPW